jgi:hypothetical protein
MFPEISGSYILGIIKHAETDRLLLLDVHFQIAKRHIDD